MTGRDEPADLPAGNGLHREADSEASPSPVGRSPFYALDVTKFVILSICTFGLYDLYWFYRNWKLVQEVLGRDLSPFWRAFFAPLWGFSLFRAVHDSSTRHNLPVGWSGGVLGTVYFIWLATWRLPDSWWLISVFSFLPIIPVQLTINELALQHKIAPDRNYSAKHVAVILLGGLLTVLAVIGTVMPVE